MALAPTLSLADLKTEVDAALTALITAVEVVQKFDAFLGPAVVAEVNTAVNLLKGLKALVDKL
jgi:hypothetical protein